MEDNNFPLSELSTKEEVADYICSKNNLKDEVKNILLNEYISGDVLPELSIKDLEDLKIKIGPRKRIEKFILENKNKFKEKEITEKLMSNSKPEEVKAFFENSLEFKGELNGLDGKGLLEITEDRMKELGLKLGQRKRLIKYIEYFKTLKPPEEELILVSRNSSEEEVAKFLKMRLKFSQDSIKNMELDGESLFDLKEDDVDDINEITKEEKENLKKFIRGEFDKNEEIIKIDSNSSMDDIYNFLKKKLNFSNEAIENMKEQDIDPETFFSLTEKDMNEFEGISDPEKEKLNLYLSEYRKEKGEIEIKLIKEVDNEDKVDNNSKEKLNSLEQPPKEEEKPKKPSNEIIIKKYEEKKEELVIEINKENKKENIKNENNENYIKKESKQPKKNIDNNEVGQEESKSKKVSKGQNTLNNSKINIKNYKDTNIQKEKKENDKHSDIKKNVKDENVKNKKEKNDIKNVGGLVPERHIIKEEKSKFIKFSNLKKYTVCPIKNAPCNIFFFITMTEWQEKSAEISVYREETAYFSNSTYYILKSYLIHKRNYKNDRGGYNYFYLFQVPLEKQIKRLTISIKKDIREQYNALIITNSIEHYFQVNKLEYDLYDDNFPIVDGNNIFSEYLDCFFGTRMIYMAKNSKKV